MADARPDIQPGTFVFHLNDKQRWNEKMQNRQKQLCVDWVTDSNLSQRDKEKPRLRF